MTALAENLDAFDAYTAMGTIDRIEGEALVVVTSRGLLRAKRATSCLVAPVAGDLVLFAAAPAGPCFVLSVLERASGTTRLAIEGDVDLDVPSGKLRIAAREGIELVTPKEAVVAAGRLHVHARRARIALEELAYLGGEVASEIGRARLHADSLDTVIGRLTQRVKASFRRIEEIDQLDARRIDYKARDTLALRADSAVIAAQKVVKVDGDPIMMG